MVDPFQEADQAARQAQDAARQRAKEVEAAKAAAAARRSNDLSIKEEAVGRFLTRIAEVGAKPTMRLHLQRRNKWRESDRTAWYVGMHHQAGLAIDDRGEFYSVVSYENDPGRYAYPLKRSEAIGGVSLQSLAQCLAAAGARGLSE